MPRFLVVFVTLVAAILLGRAVWFALESDEKKIRRRLGSMVEGFNERNLGAVLEGLDPKFKEKGSGAGRTEVQGALTHLFFTQTDKTGFLLRAECDVDAAEVVLNEDGSAQVRIAATIHQRIGDAERPWWELQAAGTMKEGEDGWVLTEITELNHKGRGRLR